VLNPNEKENETRMRMSRRWKIGLQDISLPRTLVTRAVGRSSKVENATDVPSLICTLAEYGGD
jgi:hypothetical protein